MAEVFGVISGGLSVVSVAIQLADSIKKLRDFCDLVKEAPSEVRLALDELEVLGFVLQDIEQSFVDKSACCGGIETAVIRSVRLCKVSSDALKSLAEELHHSMASGKRWQSIKAAVKIDRLSKLRGRLEGAKTTLMLANQCYYNAVQRQGWEMQRRDMSELKFTISTLTRKNHSTTATRTIVHVEEAGKSDSTDAAESSSEFKRSKLDVTDIKEYAGQRGPKSWSLSLLGSFEYRKTRRPKDPAIPTIGTNEDVNVVAIQLPMWLKGTRYEFRSRRAYTGWDYTFRTYNMIPQVEPVFPVCRRGRVEELQSLFDKGLASPFDIDTSGWTLLHYAAEGAQVEMTRFLLSCGLDANSRSSQRAWDFEVNSRSTPLHVAATLGGLVTRDQRRREDFHSLLRLLIEEGGANPLDTDGLGMDALETFMGPTSSFLFLLEKALPIISTNPHEQIWSARFQSYWSNCIETLRAVLPNNRITPQIAMERDRMGATFLHHATSRWLDALDWDGRCSSSEAQDFNDLLRETRRANPDVHAITYHGESPLVTLLFNRDHNDLYPDDTYRTEQGINHQNPPSKSRRALVRAIGAWLRMLYKHGVDVDSYVEIESSNWNMAYLRKWCRIKHLAFKRDGSGLEIEWKLSAKFAPQSPSPPVERTLNWKMDLFNDFWKSVHEWDDCIVHGSGHEYCNCFDFHYGHKAQYEEESDHSNSAYSTDGSDTHEARYDQESDDANSVDSADSYETHQVPRIPGSWD